MYSEFFDMMTKGNFVVLDTESTGLERPAEICSIAIIAPDQVLLDCLVHTKLPIPPGATAIHGITDDMVSDVRTWPQLRPVVLEIIAGKDVIVYNAAYDRKLMHWSDEAWEPSLRVDYKERATWWCAMEMYAAHHGERHPYYGTYVWQKLGAACLQMNIPVGSLHNARADAEATLKLIQACHEAEFYR